MQNKSWEKIKVHTEPCSSLQLTGGYPPCQTHRWASAGWSWCWPILVIPLKKITRSRIKKDIGDAWSAFCKLPLDSVPSSTKSSWKSTTLSWWCTVSQNGTEQTPGQAINHPCNMRTTKTKPWAAEQWTDIIIFNIY